MDRFCVAVAVFFLITIPNLVNAEDKHVLSIGIGTGYPPYYYKSDGKLKGVCIEIVDGVCARLGMQAEYVEYPWRRLLLSAKKGEVDAILPLFKTEERQEFLRFGDLELAYEEVYLFVEKGSSLERQNHEQLLLNPIGVVAGYSYGPRFDELENITKVTTQSDMHQIRMFSHNRFSVGIGNRFVVTHYAQQVGRGLLTTCMPSFR